LRNTMTPPIYDYNVESLLLELKLKPLQDWKISGRNARDARGAFGLLRIFR
jgi:hypothetical protein